MSWTFSAAGHAVSEETEKLLHDALGGLLNNAEVGTGYASFAGSSVSGDPRGTTQAAPHLLAAPDREDVAAEEPAEPEPPLQ